MIQPLKDRTHFQSKALARCYPRFKELIDELRERSLSEEMVAFINQRLDIVNRSHDEKELKKVVRKAQYAIIKKLQKDHKIVPKGYYTAMWMALGMSVFGIPMGAAFGAATDNMGLLGIGIPIGMALGMAIGAQKDAQAAKNGLQLKFKNS